MSDKNKISLPAIPTESVVKAVIANMPNLNPVRTLDVVQAELDLYLSSDEYSQLRERYGKGQVPTAFVITYVAANCVKKLLW